MCYCFYGSVGNISSEPLSIFRPSMVLIDRMICEKVMSSDWMLIVLESFRKISVHLPNLLLVSVMQATTSRGTTMCVQLPLDRTK